MAQSLHGHEARDVDAERPAVPAPYWNPYLVGALLGFVLLATYAVTERGLGATAGFAAVATWIAGNISPEQVTVNPVHAKYYNGGAPLASWTLFLLIGAFTQRFPLRLAGTARARLHRARSPQQRRQAARAGARRRRARRLRGQDREGLHERAGADRWRDAQCRQPRVHGRGLRVGLRTRVVRAQGVDLMLPLSSAFEFSPAGELASRSSSDWVSASASSARASAARAGSPRCSIATTWRSSRSCSPRSSRRWRACSCCPRRARSTSTCSTSSPRTCSRKPRRPRVRRRLHRGRLLPGTCVAAMATGRKDAAAFALGMLCGVYAYAEFTPWIDEWIRAGAKGEIDAPDGDRTADGRLRRRVRAVPVVRGLGNASPRRHVPGPAPALLGNVPRKAPVRPVDDVKLGAAPFPAGASTAKSGGRLLRCRPRTAGRAAIDHCACTSPSAGPAPGTMTGRTGRALTRAAAACRAFANTTARRRR